MRFCLIAFPPFAYYPHEIRKTGGNSTVKNTKPLFSSNSGVWETPQEFFDRMNEEFHFDLDVCALPENAKCERYYTPEEDGLIQPWDGVCWCNPPYGRGVANWLA